MKVNTRICCALRLMADIARQGQREPVPLKDVAQRQAVSRAYLSQLAIPLKNACLLRSVWGNKGGYLLGHPPSEIRVLDIIEAMDGPLTVIDCVADPAVCPRTAVCECIPVWREMNAGILRTLTGYTLADLAGIRNSNTQLGMTS